ncbi:hypothetical protein B0H16DRAFT_1698920 [Mycena metata]|uniref:Uncharacterized protein n=1 Tax=Mycena metata TaxID=1033252 RepID=A0AAD7HLU4_9AGAR|nr:hypothetical protein B0H16DRAFT_1698920 [Mycena metata]
MAGWVVFVCVSTACLRPGPLPSPPLPHSLAPPGSLPRPAGRPVKQKRGALPDTPFGLIPPKPSMFFGFPIAAKFLRCKARPPGPPIAPACHVFPLWALKLGLHRISGSTCSPAVVHRPLLSYLI